jgi:ubiquinone/menaquinone biosynthesis C-methylase UbiE
VNSNPIADYDKGAVSFDDYYSRNLGSSALELWEKLPVKEGQVIVDLACGTGFFTTKLAHAVGQTGQIIAVDFSDWNARKKSRKSFESKFEQYSLCSVRWPFIFREFIF